ncbi:RND family efflux transporter MFP subunit [Oxalobacteraceae bacterium GrIS 2.11]
MTENRHAKMAMHAGTTDSQHHLKHGTIVRRAKLVATSIVVLLLIAAAITSGVHVLHNRNLANATEEHARVYVTTIHATSDAKGQAVTLPATLQGIIEAPIFARSSGYVLRWNKDIGSSVAKDEVLALIDTPEVDAQLAQATAARAQQAASLDLAKTTAERWEELRKKDAVTQQDLNEKRSAYTQAVANLAAADADMLRLKKLESFKKILAPFSGVITRRDVEIGDLVSGGNGGNGGTGRALFTLAKVDPIRLYVYVPQTYAQRIKIDDPVSVTLTEHPGEPVQGKVKHIAGAIDAATRSLQVEINLPNHDGKLLAGSYVQVTLTAGGAPHILRVPSNALLFRPIGTQVAVVDNAGHVKLHTVTVGHDFGTTVEILSGISAEDELVLNPADSLADNDVVTVAKPDTAGKPHS